MVLPMFPLGAVLLPGMPLALRVFEPRYVALLRDVLRSSSPEFGVVLIERGFEVGGGDTRFAVGTIATLTGIDPQPGWIGVSARGGRRFEVLEWLPEDPYPRARTRLLERLVWSDADAALRADAERLVRRLLARASEFDVGTWPAEVPVSDDPAEAAWQLAGIAPLQALDHYDLLRSATMAELLDGLCTKLTEAREIWDFPAPPA